MTSPPPGPALNLTDAVEAAAPEIQRVIEGWMNYDDEDWQLLATVALTAALPSLAEAFAAHIEAERARMNRPTTWCDDYESGMDNAAALVRALGGQA